MADFAEIDKQFPEFTQSDFDEFHANFQSFDADGSGTIDRRELIDIVRQLGQGDITEDGAAKMINEVDVNQDGVVSYYEFLRVMRLMRSGQATSFSAVASGNASRLKSQWNKHIENAKPPPVRDL